MYLIASDDVLLRRFSEQGDAQAFCEIARRYAAFVFSACHRVLQDHARAEDVSQETFLRLMRKPKSVDRSLPGWLHKTATHLAIDAIRSESSRRAREVSYATDNPREASTWQEISPYVDAALADLPDEARAMLVEHFLEGVSQRELATRAGVSTATVCRRIQQGLELLRGRLKGKGVIVGGLVLSEWLALNTAEAAPPALRVELGKMAMLSGSDFSPPAGAAPPMPLGVESEPIGFIAWVKLTALTAFGAAMLGLLVGAFWARVQSMASEVNQHAEPQPAAQVQR